MDSLHWLVLIFQIISTLAVIQTKFPGFWHNCLFPKNILVNRSTKTKPNCYKVNSLKFMVLYWPNVKNYRFLSGIRGIENDQILQEGAQSNITHLPNRYSDMHLFLNCMTLIIRKSRWGLIHAHRSNMPTEVIQFIETVPLKYRHPLRYRSQHTEEYILPTDVLKDPFFECLITPFNKN